MNVKQFILSRNPRSRFAIYADGSCIINPGGYGGWAFIVVDTIKNKVVVMRLGFSANPTTNQRMKLTAIIEASKYIDYKTLQRCTLYCDCSTSINIAAGLGATWKARDWRGSTDRLVKNIDLVNELLEIKACKDMNFQWQPVCHGEYNKEVKKLAREAARRIA